MQSGHIIRLLLVEDEPLIALAQKQTLQSAGYEVEHLCRGEDAVARARQDGSFHLVLMDIDLGPGIDGPEAARRILEIREIPIVFLTAHTEREMVDRVRRITRYGYVLKSSGDFVLREAIEMALELFSAHLRTRRELEKNEAILRAIPDLYFVMTRDGTFVEARSPDPGRLAVPAERVAGIHLSDLFPPEEVERHLLLYRTCLKTGRPQLLEYALESGGSRQIYEARLVKLDEGHLLAISRDVTVDRERERRDRHANQEHLIRKLGFQELVARVSRGFMLVREEIGSTMESALEQLGRFFASDRCYLVEMTPEDTLRGRYEWTASGVAPTIERINGTPVAKFPWILERVHAGETVRITNAADLPPEASVEREMLLERDVVSALFIPLISGERTEGYLGFHVTRGERSWTEEEHDQMRVLGEILARALFHAQAQSALARERLLMDVLMDRSLDYIYFKDRDSRFLRASRSMALLHGREDPRELVGLTDLDRMTEGDAQARFEQEREIMNSGSSLVDLEEEDRRPDGSICWHSTSKLPLYDERGEILGIFGISRDITERMVAREKLASYSREQELLLRELHHRVRNTMNTMRSLISLHAAQINDEQGREIIRDLQTRIMGMISVFDQIDSAADFRSIALPDYLEKLLENLRDAFGRDKGFRLEGSFAPCTVDSRIVFPLGLVVNELVTNSFKHGFGGTKHFSGEEWVRISLEDDQDQWIIRVCDNGVGFPPGFDPSRSSGFGMQLIKALTEQIRGSFSVNISPASTTGSGSECVVRFPDTT